MSRKRKARLAKAKSQQRRRNRGLGSIESLEDKRLFCVDWSFSGGALQGIATTSFFGNGETVVLDTNSSGQVTDQGSLLRDCQSNTIVTVPANQVNSILVRTKAGRDTVDLSAVDLTKFPNLRSVTIEGGTGADSIRGSQIGDTIYGNMGADQICGLGGNDVIRGGWGGDSLCGGDGNDRLYGQEGGDVILGGAGNDKLVGGAGGDLLDGGAGRDSIYARKSFQLFRDTIYRDSQDFVSKNRRDREHNGSSGRTCGCEGTGGGTDPCEPFTDFGDAPDSYGTTLAQNGARHLITPTGPRLGNYIDDELNGQPSNATKDDVVTRDDEDGVTFVGGTSLHAGGSGEVQVNVQNLAPGREAKLNAWIDFNGDGKFTSVEQIITNQNVENGTETHSFNIPYEGVRLGETYARFRINKLGGSGLGPTGPAQDGEVEDYQVRIDCDHGGVGFNGSGVIMANADLSHSFTDQIGFVNDNIWGSFDYESIDFSDVEGLFPAEYYQASHGVRFENVRQIGVRAEGVDPVQTLDGFDGSYLEDGANVLATWRNDGSSGEPFEIVFDEPVSAISSFVGMGVEGDENTITIEAYGEDGSLVRRFNVTTGEYEDGQNQEGYWALESDEGVSRIVMTNNNTTDFGNALIVGDLRWEVLEAPQTIEEQSQAFTDSFAGQMTHVIDFEDVMGTVDPDQYLASHGVQLLNEGSMFAESAMQLDGYDGSMEPAGSQILVAENTAGVAPLTMQFETPLSQLGMFLAAETTPEGFESNGYIVTVFGANDQLLSVQSVGLEGFEDASHAEGFFEFAPDDLSDSVHRVTIEQVNGFGEPGSAPILLDNVHLVYHESNSVIGDFDSDGLLNGNDVNLLTAQVASGSSDVLYDMNGDGMVDRLDLDTWLVEAGTINLGAAYLPGDANLDGVVDVADFNAWNANKFTASTDWTAGNFNGDAVVDVGDFNTWNTNKFTSSDRASRNSMRTVDLNSDPDSEEIRAVDQIFAMI